MVVLYDAVPIFLPDPSSLKVIAVPDVIVPDTAVSDDAADAAVAKITDDRFKLEAGCTAKSRSTLPGKTQPLGYATRTWLP